GTAERLTTEAVVNAAIARLDTEGREVVMLIGGAQLTYEEAATALGVPVGTVRSRYSRARARLRDLIPNEDGNEDEVAKGGAR
ncbi:MAG TPA: sigma factor-like helix-turn-helix DNA-binding protein, partial [Acidimicrobiales bacterium]|nr:sigma factor-like helix-turn-helix DNA-binding protein [Acidimicrobiales bacterium]